MDINQFLEKYAKVPVHHYPHKVIDKPKVSVCVQTYQHAPFIKECLDGILMQQTNFSFEILLGEDASTDGTRDICIEYAKKYPDKVRLFLHHRKNNIKINGNPTGRFNFLHNLFTARGKYIALCEGDDYWTDPLKLQKQVDVLEKFNKISIVSHACKRISSKHTEEVLTYNGKSYLDLSDYLISQPFCATASLVFKKEVVDGYKGWMYHLFAGDFVLRYLAFLKGDMYYINDVMSVYNKGVEGSWSKRKMTTQKALREYKDNCRMLSYMRGQSTKLTENAVKTKKKQLRMNVIMKIAISKNLLAGLFYLVKKKEITSRNILRYVKLKVL